MSAGFAFLKKPFPIALSRNGQLETEKLERSRLTNGRYRVPGLPARKSGCGRFRPVRCWVRFADRERRNVVESGRSAFGRRAAVTAVRSGGC